MKKSNAQPLKEVIHEYVEALKMKQKLREVSLLTSWEKIVGKTISRATRDIYIRDRILYVILNSSVIRNELHNLKDPLIKRLNEEVQADVIDDISFK
jgi:predicted nucleic acid-binding Zn ribbon protein